MLAALGIGIVIGVLLVIGLLKLMMSEDPSGCLILFGLLIFFVIWSGLVARWLVFVG